MAFPIIIGNSTKDIKDNALQGAKIRNCSQTAKKNNKSTEWETKATELLMELQKAKNQLAKSHNENLSLKSGAEVLKIEHEHLKRTVEVNKAAIEKNLDQLNVEINKREADLKEAEKKCILQKEHYTSEIEDLKRENKKLTHKIKSLEGEMDSLKIKHSILQKENEEYQQKLKTTTKEAKNEMKSPGSIPKTFKNDAVSENLLLSDIFFKPRSFNENESVFFDSKPPV